MTAVSIPNTALNIALIDTSGTIVDSLTDPGTPDAGSSATFVSMERDLTNLSWVSAETSTNLLNDQLGSPGVTGHTLATPTEITTIEEPITEAEAPITEDLVIELEIPNVEEAPVDPAPIVIEESATETDVAFVIEPIVVSVVDEPTVPDAAIEASIEDAPIEPTAAPEPAETILTPIIETVIVNAAPAIDDVPAETTPVVNVVAIEETTVTTTESESIETLAAETTSTPEVDVLATEAIETIRPGDLIISGVYPSPNSGDDEWVSLTNATHEAIDLIGVTLVDSSGAITALNSTIHAQATIYILNPKGKLNNDGDHLVLINSTGTVISSAEYGTEKFPAPKKGESLLFSSASAAPEAAETPNSESYEEPPRNETITTNTAPTANGAPSDLAADSSHSETPRTTAVATTSTSIPATHSTPNIATRIAHTSTATKPKNKKVSTRRTTSRSSPVTPKIVHTDEINMLADDTLVTLEGIVIALPGTIGKRSFFLNGLEIYQNQGDLAAVSVGDHVRITGTVSVLSDHRRVNIKAGGVTILGISPPTVYDYDEALPHGSLVRVTGTVSARDGNAIVLRIDDAHSVTIVPATGVSVRWADLAGKSITVTGVLKRSNASTGIVLRTAEDITVTEETLETAVAGTTSSSFTVPWLGVGTATLMAAAFGAWIWRHRPRPSLKNLTLHSNAL
jgi:hypothetical protein